MLYFCHPKKNHAYRPFRQGQSISLERPCFRLLFLGNNVKSFLDVLNSNICLLMDLDIIFIHIFPTNLGFIDKNEIRYLQTYRSKFFGIRSIAVTRLFLRLNLRSPLIVTVQLYTVSKQKLDDLSIESQKFRPALKKQRYEDARHVFVYTFGVIKFCVPLKWPQ